MKQGDGIERFASRSNGQASTLSKENPTGGSEAALARGKMAALQCAP